MCEQSIWPAQGSRTPDHIEKEHVTRTQSQKVYPESDGVPAEKGASWQHLCCSLDGFYLGMYRYQDVQF